MFGISIYIIQMFFILICGYLLRGDKKRFLTAAFIALFIVMAFRHARMVGYDSSSSYYTEFVEIQTAEISWPNPGLPLIMRAIRIFTNNYQWVIIITATWVCFAYYKLLVKYSENGFISVMWFMGMLFYTFLFSALKQAWAMAFLCFAYDAILNKKPIRFFCFVSLAVVFHFPALIFLPAYWIAKLRINRTFPILMFGILVVVFIFRTQILNFMTSAYANGEGEYSSDVGFIGTKFVVMILMLAYGFYQYFAHGLNTRSGIIQLSVLLYFMGIAAVIQTFCFYSNNFERLADYYYHFSILFVPLILTRRDFDSSYIDKNVQLPERNHPYLARTLAKKRTWHYSINDIDITTVLVVAITGFSAWRYISYMVNDTLLSPFYFFW